MSNTLLISLAVLGILGGILAVVLYFVAQRFKVEENPLIDEAEAGMAKKKGEKQNTPFRLNFGFPFGLKSSNGFSTTNPLGKLLCSPSFQMGKKWTFSFRFERKLDSAYKNGSPLP